jgi:hypothetical protein
MPASIIGRNLIRSSLRNQSTSSNASETRASPASRPESSHKSSSNGEEQGSAADQTRTQRLKALFRKHGWTALAVYLLLSAVDFGLTFALIYAVGAERVRQAEDWVLDALGWRRKDGEPGKFKKAVDDWKEQHPRKRSSKSVTVSTENAPPAVLPEQAVDNAKKEEQGYSAIATTAALAYVIHKTALLPVRVGITVRGNLDPPCLPKLSLAHFE